MSYEGYTEYLSEEGYYWTQHDNYDYDAPIKGPNVVLPKWYHSVDVTNGYANAVFCAETLKDSDFVNDYYDENAPKTEVGFDDEWHTDHYGNRYATKLLKYTPSHECWRLWDAGSADS